MSKNQAAGLDGAKSRLRVADIDMPKTAPHRIIVRNHAVAANPGGWKNQEYGVVFKQWPNVLGADLAGEVTEVGEDVKDFQKGDRVFA